MARITGLHSQGLVELAFEPRQKNPKASVPCTGGCPHPMPYLEFLTVWAQACTCTI